MWELNSWLKVTPLMGCFQKSEVVEVIGCAVADPEQLRASPQTREGHAVAV